MELDELDNSKHLPSISFPVKHSAIEKRAALSPSKEYGQRKAYTASRMSSASLGWLCC